MANNTANVYTKEQADSAFARKSHSHSNYITANDLMTTIFSGSFTNRIYFTCYIPGSIQFDDWEGLVALLERQNCTSLLTSLGCWGLITNESGKSFSIVGLHLTSAGIVFDCQGPTAILSITHPSEGGNRLSGRYHMGAFITARAYNTSWLRNNVAIPTSY